jgi:hypothetical protein
MKKQSQIGKLKISEALPFLNQICESYGLKLNKLDDFKLARTLFAIMYSGKV